MKNKKMSFKKQITNHNEKDNTTQPDEIIKKICVKYNISISEAQKIIKNLEKTEKMKLDNEKNKKTKPNQNITNVDEILAGILPDYNKKISIELNNVDLTFDLVTDKIDTLKESFIRTVKRNKSKKVKFHVLDNINLKIFKGEKVGIIGYNGAGKSTLLNVITGIYPPDKGIIKTYGRISPLLSLGAGFDYNYSGRKNIYLNGAVLGYDKKFLKKKNKKLLNFLN